MHGTLGARDLAAREKVCPAFFAHEIITVGDKVHWACAVTNNDSARARPAGTDDGDTHEQTGSRCKVGALSERQRRPLVHLTD
jgi:hypothetical protein